MGKLPCLEAAGEGSGRFIQCKALQHYSSDQSEVRYRNLKDPPKGRRGRTWGWCAAARAILSTSGGRRDKRERQNGGKK